MPRPENANELLRHDSRSQRDWQRANRLEGIVEIFVRCVHAAAAPWDGSSALRAVIHTFNLIDSARVHLRDGARIHGIITDGGQAVNIIPERAAAAFSVRAPTAAYLQTVMAEVRRAAEAAALGTGTTVEIIEGQGYRDMRNNMAMARRFGVDESVPQEAHAATAMIRCGNG